jgi:hypothetical protein
LAVGRTDTGDHLAVAVVRPLMTCRIRLTRKHGLPEIGLRRYLAEPDFFVAAELNPVRAFSPIFRYELHRADRHKQILGRENA